MPMSVGQARQQLVDRRKAPPKKADPFVVLTEWAIPNVHVKREKRRTLWRANLPSFAATCACCGLGVVLLLSAFVGVVSITAGVVEAIEGGNLEMIENILGIFLFSCLVFGVSCCLIGYLFERQRPLYEWRRFSISSFGWKDVPAEGVRRARFIQEEFLRANIAVDALGVDPYLVAIVDGREYFFYQWG